LYLTNLETDSSIVVSDGSLSTHGKFSPDGTKVVYSSSAYGNFDLVVINLKDTSEDAFITIADTPDAEIYGTFSPDGSLISYSSFDIKYKGTLHICSATGSQNISVSKGMGSSYNPKFSPDGKKLAFVSSTGNFMEVFICNPDGSNIKQLTHKSGNTQEFDWSGDSRKIVYEDLKEGVSSINVIDVETGNSQNLTGEKANNKNPNFQK
jgi:TolB protein